jgi:hypothetical protein
VDADESACSNAGVVVRAKAGNKKAALRIGHVVKPLLPNPKSLGAHLG